MDERARQVALWAGLAAFFGNIVGLKVLEAITGNDWAQFAGALLVSFFVAGAVYSKERLAAVRRARNGTTET
jgi:hypothetical protein